MADSLWAPAYQKDLMQQSSSHGQVPQLGFDASKKPDNATRCEYLEVAVRSSGQCVVTWG